MKLLKPIEFIYNLRMSIMKLKAKGADDITALKLNKLDQDYKKLGVQDKIKDMEVYIKHKKKLRKTNLISIFILFGFITTVLMTLEGTGKIKIFEPSSWQASANTVFALVIAFLQIAVFFIAAWDSVIKQRYYNHYLWFKIPQYSILLTSMYFNFKFFIMYLTNLSVFEKIIVAVLCVSLDILTIRLISFRHDLKNNITSFKDKTKKLGQKEVKTIKPVKTKKVKTKNLLRHVKTKKIVRIKTLKVKTFKVKTKQVKTLEVKTPVKTIEVKTQKVKTDQNPTVKTNSFDIEAVEQYIINSYIPGDLITWADLKNNFSLSEYQIKKVRKYLKGEKVVKTEGTKTYRILSSKDKNVKTIGQMS